MTRFRYYDWSDIKANVSNSRIGALSTLDKYQNKVSDFQNESKLKGETWSAAKEYSGLTVPIARAIQNILIDVGGNLDKYIGDFDGSVGQVGKDLDSNKLESLQDELTRVKSAKKAAIDNINKITANGKLPNNYFQNGAFSSTPGEVYNPQITNLNHEIKILDLYKGFEERHTNDYSAVLSAIENIKKGIKELSNPKNFDSKTGKFNLGNIKNEEWYNSLINYNSIERDPAIDIEEKAIQLHGDGAGVQYIYRVYINGKYNKDASLRLQKIMEKEGRAFISEMLGVTDFLKALNGKDPFTGKKITSQERAKSLFFTLLMVAPAGKAAKTIRAAAKGERIIVKIGKYDDLDKILGSLTKSSKVTKYDSAESVNLWWKKRGYNFSPYTPRTVVQNIRLTKETKFIRVYDGKNSTLKGGWFMRPEDIKGLSALEIQKKFSLPTTPKYIGEVTFPKGTELRVGETNKAFGFEGGGIQFDSKQVRIGEFKELGKIKK